MTLYPNDFHQRVGFDRVLAMAEKNCLMARSQEMLSEISFMTDLKSVDRELTRCDEMRTILFMEEGFPEDGFVDTISFLSRVRAEGTFLSQHELGVLRKALIGVERVTRYLRGNLKYPALAAMTEGVEEHGDVVRSIDQIIDELSNVRDSASVELSDIRRAIASREREATKRIHSILQAAKSSGIVEDDANLSMRDGRALLPVLASAKRKIKGLVHDESATGKTVYIEPLEVVEINNEIRELIYSEGREIIRILTVFTNEIRPIIDSLTLPNEFMASIDLIRAKAKVAISMNAAKPIVVSERLINLRKARHPLLEIALRREGREIVPLDLKIDAKSHILVISGPNAGGKSVCLKTTALVQLMVQMGFLAPVAANSEITLFDNLFIDIGDQQSLDNDLSTYSSHLQNMKNILKWSSSRSLVLIDEFGTGTEPSLGGAIAETILERLEAKGVFGVITTHYTNIKYYASQAEGVINGAMAFDVQNIKPLFSLEIGKPGSSFAFEIARKIGLPEDVVKEAQSKIGDSQINIEKQLREIARDKNYWSNKREKIKKSDRRYQEVVASYEEGLKELKEQKMLIIKNAKQEAETLLATANRTIEATIREIKEANAEKEKTKEVRATFEVFREEQRDGAISDEDLKIERKMEKLRENERIKFEDRISATPVLEVVVKNEPKSFAVGDTVRMKGQYVAGKILSIDKKRIMVAFGQLTTTTTKEKIEHISNAEYRKQFKEFKSGMYSGGFSTKGESGYNTSEKRLEFKREIDLRGARVEEALEIVRIFIDEALMFGVSELKILHGKGTGALKEEIRRYLSTIPSVESAVDEHVEFGGAGITVIKLLVE
ncbi:MAG: Smr/MutS family protein [Rikenellaceae bacterium]